MTYCKLSWCSGELDDRRCGFQRRRGRKSSPWDVHHNSEVNSFVRCLPSLNALSFFSQRAELTSDKDMYLDNSSVEEASGTYPIDDDDYASASGSGKAGSFSPMGTILSMCIHCMHMCTHICFLALPSRRQAKCTAEMLGCGFLLSAS